MSTSGPEIGRLVETLGDLDLLLRAALASRANGSPGRAEDQVVDDVMDEAWTRCVVRIERIGGKGAIEALQTIEQRARLDGADSLAVREALERLGPRN
jgi:hypothetical protein